jgi:hypothetical protein
MFLKVNSYSMVFSVVIFATNSPLAGVDSVWGVSLKPLRRASSRRSFDSWLS